MVTKRKYPKDERGYDMQLRNDIDLTPKQQAFVFHYLSPKTLYNGFRAAIAAGYSEKSASSIAMKNLRQPKIEKAINIRLKEMYAGVELTIESVVARLEEVRRAAMKKGRFSSAIRATELQGKYLKMFVDRIEHLHTVEDANTDELVEMLKTLIGNVDGISYESLMGSLGGTVSAGPAGDGPQGSTQSSPTDSEGTPPAD